jgi:hypothetical protein
LRDMRSAEAGDDLRRRRPLATIGRAYGT